MIYDKICITKVLLILGGKLIMMKLNKLLFTLSTCTVCLIFTLIFTISCSAANISESLPPQHENSSLSWVQLDTKKGVPQDKIWSIIFTQPINQSTLNKSSIYIRDNNGNMVDTKLSLSENGKTVKITPISNYTPNHAYYLYITNRLQSTSSSPLSRPKCMTFTIKSDALNIDKTNNNQNIQLKKGDTILLTLPENRDGGYSWNFKPALDNNMLKIVDDTTIIPSPLPGLCGGVGSRCFVIQAVGTGKTSISLEQTRSWESVAPLSTFKLNVTVN